MAEKHRSNPREISRNCVRNYLKDFHLPSSNIQHSSKMNHFISVSEAKKIIETQIFRTEKVTLSILEAQGSYTSEPIFATLDVPSFDNSAMDGYGFRFDDLADFSELNPNHAVEIF